MSIHYAVRGGGYVVEKIKEGLNIPSENYVKVIDCNNIKEVIYIDIISNNLMNYKRISKDKILNLVTGEVIDIENSVTRKDNIKSLRETIKRLRRLINANFEGAENISIHAPHTGSDSKNRQKINMYLYRRHKISLNLAPKYSFFKVLMVIL